MAAPKPWFASASLKPTTETAHNTELIPASLTHPLRILQKKPKPNKMLPSSLLFGCFSSLHGDQ